MCGATDAVLAVEVLGAVDVEVAHVVDVEVGEVVAPSRLDTELLTEVRVGGHIGCKRVDLS